MKVFNQSLDIYDSNSSIDSNYQHIKYFLEGYRTYIAELRFKEVDIEPYHPDGSKDISFKQGYNLAISDTTKE